MSLIDHYFIIAYTLYPKLDMFLHTFTDVGCKVYVMDKAMHQWIIYTILCIKCHNKHSSFHQEKFGCKLVYQIR